MTNLKFINKRPERYDFIIKIRKKMFQSSPAGSYLFQFVSPKKIFLLLVETTYFGKYL